MTPRGALNRSINVWKGDGMIRYTADGKVDRDMVSVPSFGTTTKDELADALDGAMQVTRDAIASMRECESRMRSAEDERDALRSALVHLEQAYSNKHSPQHRAAALNQAAGVLMIVDGCQAVRGSDTLALIERYQLDII